MSHSYLELKLSWQLFAKAPDALAETEKKRVSEVAKKQQGIEKLILASGAAAAVVVPRATLDNRLAEIRKRYQTLDEMVQELEALGLDHAGLEKSVERDLLVETLLDKAAAEVLPVSAVDAEIYYHLHPQAFERPPARRLRHILITFDDAVEKAAASAQLEGLRSSLRQQGQGGNAQAFAAAALRHSQCPTAVEGGQLGVVKRRQLFPELDAAAFRLGEREISAVLESPVGLHILRCDEILPDGRVPFATVEQKIIDKLTDERRRELQREWIKSLAAAQRPAAGMQEGNLRKSG